ncbi:hypothetical protein C8F01DRAFT_1075392 [Mycena amicta]|nr:hypothetical protein C8F01DRAFT_1075392 [Mycena amicta]
MPPRGSGEKLSEAECRVCSAGVPSQRRVWIDARSALRHLQSTQHEIEVLALRETTWRTEALIQERAEAATRARNVRLLAPQRLDGPVAAVRGANAPSMAEMEMWSRFEEGGATFSAGEKSKDDGGMGRKDFDRNAEVFGMLDPKGAAQRLGFGGGSLAEELMERDEEEELLAQLLTDALRCTTRKNGDYVIPVRWVLYRSAVYADSYTVHVNEDGEATVDDTRTTLISANDFEANYLDLDDLGNISCWSIASSNKGYPAQMPN